MNNYSFDLVPMVIGRKGHNTRDIAERTGAKIRVRGKGSGHLECFTGMEAPTPLMLVVATEGDNCGGFFTALRLTIALLRKVEIRYIEHCKYEGVVASNPAFTLGQLGGISWEDLSSQLGSLLPPWSGEHWHEEEMTLSHEGA